MLGFSRTLLSEVVHTLHPVQEKVILQSFHDLTRIWMWPENTNSFLLFWHPFDFNSFTAPACNISGMKSAHTDACKQTIFRSYNISTFTTMHFGAKPFTYWFKEEEKTPGYKDFKFRTLLAVFEWWRGKRGSERLKIGQCNSDRYVRVEQNISPCKVWKLLLRG